MNIRTHSRLLSCCLRFRCSFSTSTPTYAGSPLLAQIRSDLKTALQNRNSDRCVKGPKRRQDVIDILVLILRAPLYRSRLSVIRAILCDASHFSHSSLKRKPIESDLQVLALLKNRVKLSKTAAAEFRAAKRDDLSDIEESQIAIFQEYISLVPVASEEEIKGRVAGIIEKKSLERKRLSSSSVIRELLWDLTGTQVDNAVMTKTVRDLLREHTESYTKVVGGSNSEHTVQLSE